MTFINRYSTLKQYIYGIACSTMMTGMSDEKRCMFWVSPLAIVCHLLCVGVCAYSGTGDLRQQMFDAETVSAWCSVLRDDDWRVRQEALNVLGLAIRHGMLFLSCQFLGSRKDR